MIEETEDSARPAPRGSLAGGEHWSRRWLPPAGFERRAYLFLWVIVLALKLLTIYHFRADSDETQHAHVVWGWTTGRLPYRDLFDNHMPLFQVAFAPLFTLLGERADILIPLRFAVLPFFFISVWAIYRLTCILFSRKAAPWAALFAASLHWYFYTSTEFRPDALWSTAWLVALLVAISGDFTWKRAFFTGLLLGLCCAVSVKSAVILSALALSCLIAWVISMARGERQILPRQALASLAAVFLGGIILPALVLAYFASRGAFWIMYYCVIQHNLVPGVKRWGHIAHSAWYLPLSLPLFIAYGFWIYSETQELRLRYRRAVALLFPGLYLALLWSYFPDITRQDDLPYIPLVPLVATSLVTFLAAHLSITPERERVFCRYLLPLAGLLLLIDVWRTNTLRNDRLKVTIHSTRDVLLLTKPGDYIMDAKGDYIFRPRALYWILEPMTKARLAQGSIKDTMQQDMIRTDTKLAYLYEFHAGTPEAAFLTSNYLPFDPLALDLGVAGKEIGTAPSGGDFDWVVTIPARYVLLSETGETSGLLDGNTYAGPVQLASGPHHFHRTSGGGKAVLFLAEAAQKGFHPLFGAMTAMMAKEAAAEHSGKYH